jgi:hypothetical protein
MRWIGKSSSIGGAPITLKRFIRCARVGVLPTSNFGDKMGEDPSLLGEDFSLVSALQWRHKVTKAHRHKARKKEAKGQRCKGTKQKNPSPLSLCPSY